MLQGLESLIYQQYNDNSTSRGILFVRTIEATKHVSKWIENSPVLKPLVRAKAIVSHARGGMTKGDQQCAIEGLKSGMFNLLVSTPVLEEGLDVPDCNFIIRYQYISNEISHRQAMGRARAKDSKMFIIITKGSNMPYQQMLQQEKLKLADRATEHLHNLSKDATFFPNILEEKQKEIIEHHQRNEQIAASQHKEWPDSSKVKILCKKCKKEACRGSDVYLFGSVASPNYAVPRKEFERLYYRERTTVEDNCTYGGLVKLYKMFCNGCKMDWGIIGWLKDVGIELPILKGKSFTLQYDDKTKPLQQWSIAPFEILPYDKFTYESTDLQQED
jgi:superfamily II DNA/RNA helicase